MRLEANREVALHSLSCWTTAAVSAARSPSAPSGPCWLIRCRNHMCGGRSVISSDAALTRCERLRAQATGSPSHAEMVVGRPTRLHVVMLVLKPGTAAAVFSSANQVCHGRQPRVPIQARKTYLAKAKRSSIVIAPLPRRPNYHRTSPPSLTQNKQKGYPKPRTCMIQKVKGSPTRAQPHTSAPPAAATRTR